MYTKAENYYVAGFIPQSEADFTKSMSSYLNIFMQIIVFGGLISVIYFITKKLIVDNIRKVNKSLNQITEGNLETVVDKNKSLGKMRVNMANDEYVDIFSKKDITVLNNSIPILVFCKRRIMDMHCKALMGLDKNDIKISLRNTLCQSHVYGCTMIINKALAKCSLPIPLLATNHDHWITLCAAFHGKVTLLNDFLINYRLHLNNVTGGIKERTYTS